MNFSRAALALLFMIGGTNHFLSPDLYLAIMPPSLPSPTALVRISGMAEIAGGLGILVPLTRKLATLGLIALLVAVFPANVYAAQHGMRIGHFVVPAWMLWTRLPLQAVLIAWVYFAGWKTPPHSQ